MVYILRPWTSHGFHPPPRFTSMTAITVTIGASLPFLCQHSHSRRQGGQCVSQRKTSNPLLHRYPLHVKFTIWMLDMTLVGIMEMVRPTLVPWPLLTQVLVYWEVIINALTPFLESRECLWMSRLIAKRVCYHRVQKPGSRVSLQVYSVRAFGTLAS
jgi:hypothetical protein